MSPYITTIPILLLGFFGSSQAMDYILQNQIDLPPYWTTTCDYADTISQLYERACVLPSSPVPERDGGYWTSCNPTGTFQNCILAFTIPENFQAQNITIFAYNDQTSIHVDTSIGSIGSVTSPPAPNWEEVHLEIFPELLGPDRQINFIIEGFGDGIFDKIIIQGEQFPANATTCDPNNCTHTGYCHSFNRCTRAGFLEHVPCPKDINGHSLWWNSEKNTEHGGSCDIWSGLSLNLQEKYLEDPACDTPCEYIPHGRCSPNYSFLKLGRSFDLTCGPELVFNPEIETCDYCYNIELVEGGNCCTLNEFSSTTMPSSGDEFQTTPGPYSVFTVVNGFDDPDDQYDLFVPKGGQCFTIPPEREMDHRHEVNTNGRCFIIYLNNDCTGTEERFEASFIQQPVNFELFDQFLSIRTC